MDKVDFMCSIDSDIVKIKVLSVFGTRPEGIKMAPILKRLDSDPRFISKVCVTSQHKEMLVQVLNIFNIIPDYDLNIMKPNQDLYDITSLVLLGMRDLYRTIKPDVILVHGDTTTTMAASISAFYMNIPIGHVEAGLRTGTLTAPFPEEANRVIVDRLARFHFCPTETSIKNLLKENIPEKYISLTGNTVIDALLMVKEMVRNKEPDEWQEQYQQALTAIKDPQQKIVLITAHRRENFGKNFLNICEGISLLANRFPDVSFIYPAHLNPNVRKPVTTILANHPNIFIIDPLDYAPFVYLMNRSYMIITDSGGIQEEAPSLGKPVLVMREATERPEALLGKNAILVGVEPQTIFETSSRILLDPELYKKMSKKNNPYGDGKASERIIQTLYNFFISKSDR